MRAIVLGSAAGGGSPQWNCRCRVCELAWCGDPRVPRRTQSSLAVSADVSEWALFNCSPDFREQLGATPALWPRSSGRNSPVRSVVLANGDIDHIGGLLSLREGAPFTVWASSYVVETLRANSIMRVLAEGVVGWRTFAIGTPFEPLPGLAVEPFQVQGKVPLYMEGTGGKVTSPSEAAVGFAISGSSGRRLLYVPGCAEVDASLAERAKGAEVILFDGTLYTDGEMIEAGVGEKTGRRMGHIPISGAQGSLAAFAQFSHPRRIYVHLNNTNPVLIDGSPERQRVEAAEWEVSFDGMEIEL